MNATEDMWPYRHVCGLSAWNAVTMAGLCGGSVNTGDAQKQKTLLTILVRCLICALGSAHGRNGAGTSWAARVQRLRAAQTWTFCGPVGFAAAVRGVRVGRSDVARQACSFLVKGRASHVIQGHSICGVRHVLRVPLALPEEGPPRPSTGSDRGRWTSHFTNVP